MDHTSLAKRICKHFLQIISVISFCFAISPGIAERNHFELRADPSIEGRWDMTIYMSGKEFPSWLEVHHSGTHTLVGSFVGAGGSARPISKVNFSAGKMNFSIPVQWEQGNNDITIEGTLKGDSLIGVMV